jgi:hypothetical protein
MEPGPLTAPERHALSARTVHRLGPVFGPPGLAHGHPGLEEASGDLAHGWPITSDPQRRKASALSLTTVAARGSSGQGNAGPSWARDGPTPTVLECRRLLVGAGPKRTQSGEIREEALEICTGRHRIRALVGSWFP